MLTVCISASNIKHAGENSTSLKICKLIEKIININDFADTEIDIISLVDYELSPCIGCGFCYRKDECACDNNFNKIYKILIKADALFIVAAHYAPIPAKLAILLEKVEQLTFLKRFNNEDYRSPLYQKPVGIVAHGGGTQEIIEFYKAPVLDTIWNALAYPVEMKVIGADNENPHGVVLPVSRISKNTSSIFPVQEYDWNDLEHRLKPLIYNVLK